MASKITKNLVNRIPRKSKDVFYWDTELKGFGVKATPAGSKIFVVQYRMGGRGSTTKRYTIGKYGPLTPDAARKLARQVLGEVAKGLDPQLAKQIANKASTISDLCDDYLKFGCETKKTSTILTDKGRIERHIKPLLGKRKVKDLTSSDVMRFLRDVAKGKTAKNIKTGKNGLARVTGGEGTATRTVGLLGGIMTFAVAEGIRKDNPVKGVKRYPDKKKERFLSVVEIAKLGKALAQAEKKGESIVALNAIRLLLLTGCRKTEILSLTWHEVDFQNGCLCLKDSKTGQKIVPIGKPALLLLDKIGVHEANKYVFPGHSAEGYFVGVPKVWERVRELAGLEGVRLHDLRHSFASVGAAAGMGLQVVGKILGHADPKTTAKYSHFADDPIRTVADRISEVISESLDGNEDTQNIVNLRREN